MPTASTQIDTALAAPALQNRSRRSLDKIITAAEMILRRDGAGGFSIGALAEVSGVSIGGIYARVRGKNELFELIKMASTERIARRVKAAMEAEGLSADEVIDAFIGALLHEFSKDARLHRALLSPGIATAILRDRGSANRARSKEHFVKALVESTPALKKLDERDIDLIADVPISIIMNQISGTAEGIDWEWLSRSLRLNCKANLRALLEQA